MFTLAADDYATYAAFEIANRVNISVLQYNGDKTFVDRPFHYYRLFPTDTNERTYERTIEVVYAVRPHHIN